MAGNGILSHRSGAIAELQAQMWYLKNGYDIFTPISPQSKCDFIAVSGKNSIKVQVKKASNNPTRFGTYLQVRLQGKATPFGVREYTEEDFDELFITHDVGMWRIPFEEVKDKKSFTFGKLLEDSSVVTGNRSTVDTGKYKVE